MPAIATALNLQQLRLRIARWRSKSLLSAIVPTMGALHDGHVYLVKQALRRADRVVVSIFVNPKQFAPGEDLAKYPRNQAGDLSKLTKAGAHLAYLPDPADIYPEDFATRIMMDGPAKAGLEDKFRPQFFDGVATIVAKLFIQAGCDYAIFGEKDYQQLKVVSRMARDLDIATVVIGAETVRERSGLAMSSRNAYLSADELVVAAKLHENLQRAAQAIREGADAGKAAQLARRRLSRAGFKMDYVSARNANTLETITSVNEPIRLLAAGRLGKTRLIDNIAV